MPAFIIKFLHSLPAVSCAIFYPFFEPRPIQIGVMIAEQSLSNFWEAFINRLSPAKWMQGQLTDFF